MSSTDELQRASRVAAASLVVALLMPVLGGCVPAARTASSETPTDASAPLYTQMSEEDIRLANDTVRRALESALSGTTFSWRNPGNNHAGTVTPTSSYRAKAGFFCRTYGETLTIRGLTESYTDTACRSADGVWRPVVKKN